MSTRTKSESADEQATGDGPEPVHTASRVIDSFTGRWAFLSNFYPSPVRWDGVDYPTVEHAYQAAKVTDPTVRALIRIAPNPDEAKRLGRAHADRFEWDVVKVPVMRALVTAKFGDPRLRAKLLATGCAELVEANDWGDDFWGVHAGHGENYMGLILMAVREQARRESAEGAGKAGSSALVASPRVRRAALARVPSRHGTFLAQGYRGVFDGCEHVALTCGDLRGVENVLVRVHSECLTGDAFASVRCDCGPQLHSAMEAVLDEGLGAVLYLRGHEGRGIGLLAKLRAYALQDAGFDSVDANTALGLPSDGRDYRVAADILTDLGVRSVRLLSNNPDKIRRLRQLGVDVVRRVPLRVGATADNLAYLRVKRDRMGHDLPGLPDEPVSGGVA